MSATLSRLAPSAPPPALTRLLDRAGRRPFLALTALCLILFLPGFFTLPPSDRDESRFAQATKQMLETGDFVRIQNGAAARNQKPIGIYWLQAPFAAAARATGVAEANPIWPYRIPSLLGAIAAVFATFGFGRRLVGDRAALLGATLLAASPILVVEAHMAKTDACLLAVTTTAMFLLARAWRDPRGLSRPAALGFWAALGAAILIKGPIAPMICALTAATLAIADRAKGPPRWLNALRPRTGAGLTLAIVLPWFIAIGLATHGRFFAQSVGGDLARKIAGGDDAHGGPFGLHTLLLTGLLFAGGIPAFCAALPAFRDRARPATLFLLAWIVPSWLVFEAVTTKLPHYTMPLYPAIALLTARWLLDPATLPRWAARLACAAQVAVCAGMGFGAAALPFIAIPGLVGADALGLPVLLIAVLLIALIIRLWPDPRRAAMLMLCATPLIYTALLGIELPALRALWIAPRVAQILRDHWPDGRPPGAQLAAFGFTEPSLMFLCGTDTLPLKGTTPGAKFLREAPNHVVLIDQQYLPLLLKTLRAMGGDAAPFATLTGYNYSRGQRITLAMVENTGPSEPAETQRMK